MELNEQQRRRAASQLLAGNQFPDGPTLERFNALAMAQALEQELMRSAILGLPKISIHMDLQDAALLAAFLRKG